MGTRSTIHFQEDGETVATIYQQFDGYPDGVGLELANFLKGITIVNGIRGSDKRLANGVGCLAAQFIADHKDGPGGLYITHPDDSQEYNYMVNYTTRDDTPMLEYHPEPTISVAGQTFNSIEEFYNYCVESD